MQIDLSAEILKEHSKSNTTRVAKMLENDPGKFKTLMKIFFDDRNSIRYPELGIELYHLVREIYPYESRGFQARARKLLRIRETEFT
jgi:hypothetical protein